jgi:glycosyltransferase involved in cell wall biosynthesis
VKISIVIPAFNEEKLLAATLESITAAAQAVSARGWEHEVIVCNNNSTDRTREIAEAKGVRVVFEPINQIGRARNCGAQAAAGDWLIFVDADSHPSRALLEDVCDAIGSGRFLAGGCTVKLDRENFFFATLTNVWNAISRVQKLAAGAFIFCETRAFREVGGFSADLFASEEVEFFQRLHKLPRVGRKRVVILRRHPLLTSARKAHLYTKGEHLRFLLRTMFSLGRTLRKAESCPTWYDGRR